MLSKMICVDEKDVTTGIISTTLFFIFCRFISEIYKTSYYYVPVFIVYIINTYHSNIESYNPISVMMNSLLFIWLVCLIDKIATSVFSNIFFTIVFIYTLTMVN